MLNVDLLEDSFALNNEQKAELASLYDSSTKQFQIGKVITGKVLASDSDGVLVGIDYKSDGLIPPFEFSHREFEKIQPGAPIEVVIDRLEDEHGNVVLSYQKAKSLRAWDRISELAEKDEPVTGIVTHKVKGGLSVDIGIPAFLPGSQVDVQRVNDFDHYVNQEVTCKILKINKKRGNVIISRRKYIEGQRLEEKQHALETLHEGAVVQGIVKNITNYGAFVDIGGIDGLLHITDMSWGRISHPSELLKIGDTISVKILSLDKEHEKISLGTKQLTENPWEHVEKTYQLKSVVKGRISSIADYGLFVEVEKGVEGLVHISEISWTERITNLAKHYHVGQEVEALVVALDKDNRRMSLSIKQLSEDPWKKVAERFKEGDRVTGTVSNITDFGLFVRLDEGVDGLVHISDISWTDHVKHPSDRYKKGDTVDAVILAIDPTNRKISLGIKQLENDPWEIVEDLYPVGATVEGTVSQITNFGAFVKLASGIEGLVHISELADKEVTKVEDVLTLGQTGTFKVIKVNKAERKLGLSLKATSSSAASTAKEAAPKKGIAKEAGAQREARAVKDFVKQQKTATSSLKNPLQQALEEHAARKNDDDEA